jgi:hypothetical protein
MFWSLFISSQLRTWSFICIFVKNCHTVAWFATIWDIRLCELCGFSLWSCQLWLYLLLSCEICRVIWIFSCSTVWRVYRFLDTVLMDSDRYRCIFRSTTIVFEITRISAPYSFPTISYRFRFREKDVKTKVIWSPIDRFRSFSSLVTCMSYTVTPHGLRRSCFLRCSPKRDMLRGKE